MTPRMLVAGALAATALSAATARLLAQGQPAMPHGEMTMDCGDCHTPERWTPVGKPPRFRHDKQGFVLENAHAAARCRSCHTNLVFSRVGTACADCHKDAHRGELGAQCQVCHTPTSWANQREMFRVHDRTRFPLLAVHASLDCEACHRGQKPYEYATTPTECSVCHAKTYDQTQQPNHASVGFSRQCQDCHGPAPRSWHEARFDHTSRFPLTGAHAGVSCAACHKSGYTGTPTQCVACHRADYERTTNPNHVAGGYSTDCQACHGTSGWSPASFDHSRSRFPLTGAHTRVDCARCHTGGRYTGTPTDCYACHRANYEGTTNPNHVASGFPTQCAACHTTDAWRPANFDHGKTRFPLTGAHQSVSCEKCHTGGRYAGTPTDCVACHRADYDGATNPNHAASGFPTQCQACHTTNAWRPANFDHSKTGFPLTGAHARVSCESCHANGRYAGTPSDCVACHRRDYDGTNNPNHAAANFPTQCQQCHTTNAWRPASFDHDGRFFPIYSGRHRGTWSSCSDCHVNPNNYGVFECINCHAHSRSEMDGKHREVNGYQYVSSACLRCHPRGVGGDSVNWRRRVH